MNLITLKQIKNIIIAMILLMVISYAIVIIQSVNTRTNYLTSIKNNTVESYNEFINRYPKSEYTHEAIRNRDTIAFKFAQNNNTLESYKDFLKTFPDSDWKNNAIYFRDKLEFEFAKKEKTLKSIVIFLRNHPNSMWLSNARHYLRHQFGYNHESEVAETSD